MWYVIQVHTGTEQKICTQCEKVISASVLERCFIPYYECKKKFGGKWNIERKILFPGYVFLVTDRLKELYLGLTQVVGGTRLLRTEEEIMPLTSQEVDLLLRLGGEEQVVEMSEGIILGSEVQVYKGPLAGMEGKVRKIDRHKRKAWIEIEMFGGVQLVELGLEIVRKEIS